MSAATTMSSRRNRQPLLLFVFSLSYILRPAQWLLVAFRRMWTYARVQQESTWSRTSERDGRFALQFYLHYQRNSLEVRWGGAAQSPDCAPFPVGLSGLDQVKPDPKCAGFVLVFLGNGYRKACMWVNKKTTRKKGGGAAAMQMRDLGVQKAYGSSSPQLLFFSFLGLSSRICLKRLCG